MADIYFWQTVYSYAFVEWKYLKFDYSFIEKFSFGSNLHKSSIGSDNCLAPNRRQAVIWTSDGLDYWRIYTSLGVHDFWQHFLLFG